MVKLLGNNSTFSNHANMHSFWVSTSLITISPPPPTTKDLKDFAGLFLLFVCFWEGNAVKHGEIVGKQLYFFKPMLICIVSWCQHHLLQLAPPTTKDLKDFTGNAVKHGEIVGKQL